MPFKLRLKKSRHYNVVSKSLFIISVEALDNSLIECTLTSESTGQECLECTCQKLSVNQPQFFGLQYTSRDGSDSNSNSNSSSLRWLDLDRPVKRQLDKHASRMLLHMRVLYYVVTGVKLITDELARYHYFLQLKMDVIEGRIVCNPKQAVQLAAYCMQAEFGNYDAEKHTLDYLKDFQLFPKTFTDSAMVDSLTNAAIHQHAALHNLPQGTAEEHFIITCQHLEGYGVETFSTQDHHDNPIILGISLTGISVAQLDGQPAKFFGWMDVSNVVNHKKYLSLECVTPSNSVQFHFDDVNDAKRAFKAAVLQSIFFRKYGSNSQDVPQISVPVFHQLNITQEDKSRSQVDNMDVYSINLHQQQQQQQQHQQEGMLGTYSHLQLGQRAQSTSCLDLTSPTPIDSDRLRNLLPSYRQAPDYETAVQQKYRNSAGALPTEHQARGISAAAAHSFIYSSQPEIHRQATRMHYPDVTHSAVYRAAAAAAVAPAIEYNRSVVDLAEGLHLLHVYKPPPPYPSNRLTSNSTPDLAVTSQIGKPQTLFVSSQVSGSSPDLVSGGTFLNHHYLKQCNQVLYHHQPGYVAASSITQRNTHGTYENLASVFDGAAGNILYCLPAAPAPAGGTRQRGGSAEPIYENIPTVAAWQAQVTDDYNHGGMRSRTQSIQSAPEVSQGSRENLYANIQNESSYTKPDVNNFQQNSSTTNNNNNNITDSNGILNRSGQNLNTTHTISSYSSSSHLDTTSGSQHTTDTDSLNRNNTFTINKHLQQQQQQHSELNYSTTFNDSGNSTSIDITGTPDTNASNATFVKKRRRWALLGGGGGGNKNKEKEKSATLGREKTRKEETETRRHRWSTGLPRLQPLPPTISKETMCQLLEQKLSDSQLFFEFDKIPKKKPSSEFTTALHPYNAQFNRFKDVLPYEDNRVRLTPTRDNKFGYINASHITASVGSKQRFYVAAQGPTAHTLSSFWHCIWEAEVYLVVQLTDSTEDLIYLPDSKDRCVDIGQYQVWWELSQNTGHCVTSKVRLCHVSSRRYRAIWHLHYTDWGDQGCPHSVAHFLGFLEELRSVREHTLGDIPLGHNKNPPVLVHCTAGVGRTGLTILADLLLYTLDHNQELNVPRVVTLLRHQRAYMVQTVAQYRFVYTLLIHYLKQTRLI